MPLPQRTRSCQGKTRQAVDQARHRRDPCAMVAAVVTVCGGNTLKASDLPNGLFDHDAKLRKRPIVVHILWRAVFAARFAPRRKAIASQLRQLQIGQITADPHFLWQALQQAAVFQQLDVGGRSWHTVRHLNNPSGVTVHRQLAFECVLLFLARIVAVIVRWALHTLLKTVHNHRQFGDVLQQVRQLATAFKRVRNIGREYAAASFAADEATGPPLESVLTEAAERALLAEIERRRPVIESAVARGTGFREAYVEAAHFEPIVARFFEEIFVMSDDSRLRQARLRLLKRLETLILRLGDISEIVEP